MMDLNPMPLFYEMSVWLLPIAVTTVFHEVAHGYMAYFLGDKTAKAQHRLTLNPIAHIDPVGSLVLPIVLLLVKAPILFGWAKPVPVNFSYLMHPRRDTILIALAGPFANFLIALLCVFLMKWCAVYLNPHDSLTLWLLENAKNCLVFSLLIGVFNLLPVLPLDGGRVVSALLPAPLARGFKKIEKFGFYILLFFLVVLPLTLKIDIVGWILGYLLPLTLNLLYAIADLIS